jgi:hypothetical protein
MPLQKPGRRFGFWWQICSLMEAKGEPGGYLNQQYFGECVINLLCFLGNAAEKRLHEQAQDPER